MGNRGIVTAVDSPPPAEVVERAAERLGLTAINTVALDGRDIGAAGLLPPHKILVDAPCRVSVSSGARAGMALQPADLEHAAAAAGLLRRRQSCFAPGLLYSVYHRARETVAVADALPLPIPLYRPAFRALFAPRAVKALSLHRRLFSTPIATGWMAFLSPSGINLSHPENYLFSDICSQKKSC